MQCNEAKETEKSQLAYTGRNKQNNNNNCMHLIVSNLVVPEIKVRYSMCTHT